MSPQDMPAAVPWYRSQVMIGSVVTIVSSLVVVLPKLGAAIGLTSPNAINASVNALFEMFALGSGLWTAIARKNSPVQPVTMTQAQADAHPANAPTAPVVQPGSNMAQSPQSTKPWSIDMATHPPGNNPNNPQPSNPSPGQPGNPGSPPSNPSPRSIA